MRLTAEARKDPTRVRLTLENDSDDPVTVVTSVNTGSRVDHDWFSIVVRVAGLERLLRFTGRRGASGPRKETIEPRGLKRFVVDLAFWAQQTVNGTKKLPKGPATITATYEVTDHPGVWNGKIDSNEIAIDL